MKVPGAITHDSLISDTNSACSQMYQFEKSHLEILARANKLGAVLIQLPPFFKVEHTTKLLQLLSSFSARDYNVFVEVREKELYLNGDLESEILNEGADMVSVDSPAAELSGNFHSTGNVKYIRLHGRNTSAWWKRNTDRNVKYDYEYSEPELVGIKNTIFTGTKPGDQIFIFFNNHPSGKAPRNASRMLELVGTKTPGDKQGKLL